MTSVPAPEKPAWLFVLVGVIGGLASGLAGIGGGVIMVPLMVGFLALTQKKAQGSSLWIIIPTAAASLTIYALVPYAYAGDYEPLLDPVWLIPAFALPAMLLTPLGARLTTVLDGKQLRFLFGILLLGVAGRLILGGTVGTIAIAVSLVALFTMLGVMLVRGRRKAAP